jgi:Uma2 family endonuclease
MTAKRVPYRFSVADYERLIAVGILTENSNVELIRGEIVSKMSIGDLHVQCVDILSRLFIRAVGDDAIVSVQNPIRLSDSEPEPDVVIKVVSAKGKPSSAEILLIIEVAETSLEYDKEVKLPLYAENGIREFWIVNLIDGCLQVYREPQPNCTYAIEQTLRAGESISLLALPSLTIPVASLL